MRMGVTREVHQRPNRGVRAITLGAHIQEAMLAMDGHPRAKIVLKV
jgi:hypothetical protein